MMEERRVRRSDDEYLERRKRDHKIIWGNPNLTGC